MGELLSIDHINYTYHSFEGETHVLRDVSFCVTEGEIVVIVGPKGCGKSTLLSLIAGLLQPDSGAITINGKAIENSGKSIGYMLQKNQLTHWRNTMGNVTIGPEVQHRLSDNSYVQINERMNTYGLITFINTYPDELSDSIKQRSALIRALLMEPDILLLDEPFSALDDQTRSITTDDIWDLLRKEKKTALLITHDITEAISIADRVIVFTECPGTVKEIFPIQFSISDRTPSLCHSAPEFEEYAYQIWKSLGHLSGNS